MNGYYDFKDAEGVVHSLYFGRQAAEEFARRVEKHLTDNTFKINVDIVYSGMANNMTRLDMPMINYSDVYDMLEKLLDEDPDLFAKQMAEIEKVFWESKYGREYEAKLEEVKKKAEQEIAKMEEQLRVKPNIGTT